MHALTDRGYINCIAFYFAGSVSRYENARKSKSGQPSVRCFDTVLSAAASEIYYRDEIENISTSYTRIKKERS